MTPALRLVFPFRRLAVWLGALVLVVVLLALTVSGLVALRFLENRLGDQRVADVELAARNGSRLLLDSPYVADEWASAAGDLTGTRVALYRQLRGEELLPWTQSAEEAGSDPFARQVVARPAGTIASGLIERDDDRTAEAAIALVDGSGTPWVAVFSRSASDVRGTVDVVSGRLLVAGLVAAGSAVLVGFLAAYALAQRIRRLDRAAQRIAAGDLAAPIGDPGRDEVAELAASLETMRRRLERTDAARREFIQNASHELRTPLFAIGGYLELLEDEPDDEPQRDEFLGAIRDQVGRLTRLSSDLLDLSRIDADRLGLEREPIALESVAATVAADHRARADARGVDLAVAEGAALAEGDEQRVAQIARALVENAIRHNPAGTHVRLAPALENGHAVLAVSDDGPAIADADAARIFGRFERASGGEGSGLGLAIARELAERMDGELELVQVAGGKTFRLVLPRAAEDGS